MRFIAAVFALLVSFAAQAQIPTGLIINGQGTATLTVTLPTQYVGGTPLPASERAGWNVFYGSQSRFSSGTTLRQGCAIGPSGTGDTSCYSAVMSVQNGSQTSTQLTLSLNQETTIYFAAIARATNGNWSNYSNETAKRFVLQVVDNRQPGEPVIESVDVTMTCTTNDANFTCTFSVGD